MPRRAAADPLQLKLFDDPSPLPVEGPSPDRLPAATDSRSVPVPAEPARDGVATEAPWRHPQADQAIELAGRAVGYRLRRASRRSIGFVVGADGLSVDAPKGLPLSQIESALTAKAGWIVRKLDEQRERCRRLAAARVEWRDGACIPFLGESLVVVLDPQVRGVRLDPPLTGPQSSLVGVATRELRLGLPHTAEAARIRRAVLVWLQREARRLFEARCGHFAPRLGVRWTRLGLSSARTRWGSANASGAIRFNWRLVHFDRDTVDYVVAHELAHLREMNHGPRFWAVVRSVVPDYERARRRLASDVLPVFD